MSEPSRFDCPQCGPGVSADEDGCCASCGADCAVQVDGEPCKFCGCRPTADTGRLDRGDMLEAAIGLLREVRDADFRPDIDTAARVSAFLASPMGTAPQGEPREDAGTLPSQHLPAESEPDPTVFAVVYASYADEVYALYKTRELANAERDRLGGMWEVSEWTVNSTPDKP